MSAQPKCSFDPLAKGVGAHMPSARKTALAEHVCDSERERANWRGLVDAYADMLRTIIAAFFHSPLCSRM